MSVIRCVGIVPYDGDALDDVDDRATENDCERNEGGGVGDWGRSDIERPRTGEDVEEL